MTRSLRLLKLFFMSQELELIGATEEDLDMALTNIVNKPGGRLFLWDLLNFTGFFSADFATNEETQYKNGKRAVGAYIFHAINKLPGPHMQDIRKEIMGRVKLTRQRKEEELRKQKDFDLDIV